MIQYDRNMSSDDIVTYWAGGYVLYRLTDSSPWWLATVSNADDGELTLQVHDEEGTVPVKLDRETFFDRAILHRPVVNLVEHGGIIYRLSWIAPDRTANRAISHEAISATRLAPLPVWTLEHSRPLLKHQHDLALLKAWIRKVPYYVSPNEADRPIGALGLLLAHMNRCEHIDCNTVLGEVAHAGKTGRRVGLLSPDTWVQYVRDGFVRLMAGSTELCLLYALPDGLWAPVGGYAEVSKVWRPTVMRELSRSHSDE